MNGNLAVKTRLRKSIGIPAAIRRTLHTPERTRLGGQKHAIGGIPARMGKDDADHAVKRFFR